jgi:hypothetical protein
MDVLGWRAPYWTGVKGDVLIELVLSAGVYGMMVGVATFVFQFRLLCDCAAAEQCM